MVLWTFKKCAEIMLSEIYGKIRVILCFQGLNEIGKSKRINKEKDQ